MMTSISNFVRVSFIKIKLNFSNQSDFVNLVNNLRLKLDRLSLALEELASKGPLKPEELRGLEPAGFAEYIKSGDITVTTGVEKMEKFMPRLPGTTEVKDESNYRTGYVLGEEMTQKMLAQSMVMKELIHESSV